MAAPAPRSQARSERQRVDCWLDQDARLGADAIREQVEAWDTSELPPEFRLAQHVPFGEDVQGLDLFRELLADGGLTAQEAEQWRLFARWPDENLVQEPEELDEVWPEALGS